MQKKDTQRLTKEPLKRHLKSIHQIVRKTTEGYVESNKMVEKNIFQKVFCFYNLTFNKSFHYPLTASERCLQIQVYVEGKSKEIYIYRKTKKQQ